MNHKQLEALKAATHGHTPGPWLNEMTFYHMAKRADATLAAAAPDLLAEVERLRGALAEIWDNTKEFEIRVLAGNALDGAEVPK